MCSNGTVPSSCSRFATLLDTKRQQNKQSFSAVPANQAVLRRMALVVTHCQPRTIIIPEPKPHIPLPTLATTDAKQYTASAGTVMADREAQARPGRRHQPLTSFR